MYHGQRTVLVDATGDDAAPGGILLFLLRLVGAFHGKFQLSGSKGIGMVCFGGLHIQQVEVVMRIQDAVGTIEAQIILACRIQVDSRSVKVFAEILHGAFPAAYLLVGPFAEAFPDVGCQEIHSFVEVSSVGGSGIVYMGSECPCHQHDVDEMSQVVL